MPGMTSTVTIWATLSARCQVWPRCRSGMPWLPMHWSWATRPRCVLISPACKGIDVIYGVGTDICDVRRIRDSLQRHGDRFARKLLSDAEYATWQARSARWPERGIRYLATRFSAKEAFSKAIGLGMTMPMTWRACEIGNVQGGRPVVVLHGEL